MRLSYFTRKRLLTFCKKLSKSTIGHTGFSVGSSATFTTGAAFQLVASTVSLWFLYASMQLGVYS
jgi:hypothetical protein